MSIKKGHRFETRLSVAFTKEVAEELYVKQWLTTTELGEKFNVSRDSIVLRLHQYGIPVRRSRVKYMDKATLEDLYLNRQWSTIKIAQYFKVHDETIRGALIRHSIPIRSKSEAGKVKEWTPEHLAKLKEGARKVNLGKIGPLHHAWKGGRHINSYGYVLLRINKKYVLEHRHVMQEQLGRPLLPWEEVNHINGIRTDNSPENLEVIYSEHRHKDWLRRHASIDK